MRFDTTIETSVPFLLKEGEATFEVLEAIDVKSKEDGTEQIKMKVCLTDSDGRSTNEFVYLTPKYSAFIKGFCDAIGEPELFEGGYLEAAHCSKKKGRCVIAVSKGKKKPDSEEFYNDKMAIKKFINKNQATTIAHQSPVKINSFLDDDLPF